jgi:hypothetical protein
MITNQQFLNNYFATVWRNRNRSLDQYQYSGWELIGKILPGERVLDVGCGDNPFRDKIANLVGVDPAFPEADHTMTIQEFSESHRHMKFNVAFCLGSINFGTKDDIEQQIRYVVGMLRQRDSRIYWRCNPGQQDHGNQECQQIDFYPWSFDEHIRLADMFDYRINEMDWDSNNRIYAEWISNKTSAFMNPY